MNRSVFWLIIAIGLACSIQCKKEKEACMEGLEKGSIIGQDLRLCACCGGWFIELESDTVRAFTLPDGFLSDPSPDLPIPVCLSYHDYVGPCSDFGEVIEIDQIIKR